MSKSKITARPLRHSPAVRELALRQVLGNVLKWLPSDKREPERALAVLVAAFDSDSQLFAAKLERRGWHIDEQLIKILDQVSTQAALDEITAAWVDHFNIRVPFEVGDRVATERFRKALVIGVNSATAELTLSLADDDLNIAHVVPAESAIALRGTAIGAAA